MNAYFDTPLATAELRRRTGDLTAFASIRESVLDNGSERGVRSLLMRNASGLEVEVLVDRGFDLGGARWRGMPFGWRSGNGFRHPGLHEADAEGGLSWLRALDGLLVTGGLDHALFGGEYDASHYAYPAKQSVTHGLHGRLTAIPARLLSVEENWQEVGGILRVRGEVIQATSFGEHLRLERTIEMDMFGDEVRVFDSVSNLGFERTPHMFLYHLNLGWPFVDEGSKIVAPIRRQLWASDSTKKQGVPYTPLPAPMRGFIEQVWEHELQADESGDHRVALVRPEGNLGVLVRWDSNTMPNFFEWQNMREGQYGLGLEPSTNHVAGEQAARDLGELTWLEHGETRDYRLAVRILNSSEDITGAVQSIDDIRSTF